MVFDALDGFTFTSATGFTVTEDKSGGTASSASATVCYSDAFDLKKGGTGFTQPCFVVVRYTDVKNQPHSASSTVRFDLQTSNDGATWTDRTDGGADAITGINGAARPAGVVNLPLVTEARYIRLAIVLAPGAGSTVKATIKSADLNISQL